MQLFVGRGINSGASPAATGQSLVWRRMHLSVLPPASALLQRAIPGSGGNAVTLVANLQRPATAPFHDHMVQGRAVFPGAGYLELAVSGAEILTGEQNLSNDNNSSPTSFHRKDSGRGAFSLHTRTSGIRGNLHKPMTGVFLRIDYNVI